MLQVTPWYMNLFMHTLDIELVGIPAVNQSGIIIVIVIVVIVNIHVLIDYHVFLNNNNNNRYTTAMVLSTGGR